MPSASAETRIKTVQANANRLWEAEAKYWNTQAEHFTREAAKATSPNLKKSNGEKENHAADCVNYCRSKVV